MKIILNKRKKLLTIASCMVFIVFGTILCNGEKGRTEMKSNESVMKVLLLGASVGNGWGFDMLPKRLKNESFSSEFIAKYEPDKTDILEQVLDREDNKPDVIIIKQCAAYFRSDTKMYDPSPAKQYKQLMETWVDICRKNKIIPVLATVVPITQKMPLKVRVKRWVKKYMLFKKISPYYRPMRLKGIMDYNNWVNEYSRKNRLPVLDLEAAVRVSKENRYLSPELTTDGLHLNDKAYKRLDAQAQKLLKQVAEQLKTVRLNEL